MRIASVNIPDNKRVHIALTYIYGIGDKLSQNILRATKIKDKLAKELTSEEVNHIQEFIEKHYKVEGALRQVLKQNLERLKEIRSYRGIRHMRRLPVRGQTTKTNSRTVRGNVRKTAGSGKRKVDLK